MAEPEKLKRIALFYPWGNLDTVPLLCNGVDLLAREGFSVELFTTGKGAATARFQAPHVSEFTDYKSWKPHGLYRVVPRRWYPAVVALRRHMQRPYCLVMGVDPQGLVDADRFNRLIRAPMAYVSLELLLSGEIPASRHDLLAMKRAERRISAKCKFIVSPDESRAKLLAEDNGIPMSRFVFVPNSPMGPARRKRSDFWHRKFGLAAGTRVVLYAGSLYQWAAVEKIAGSVNMWPDGWVLVIHCRGEGEAAYTLEVLKALVDRKRVFISDTPVPREQYGEMIDGADIGIAFYVPVPGCTYSQRNIRTLGLSSGKLAFYLGSGLPVIVNRFATIGEFVRSTQCGVDVEGAEEIGSTIKRIASEYNGFSVRARAAFDNHLDFGPAFRAAMERVKRV